MKKEIPATVEQDEDEFLEDEDETEKETPKVDPKEQERVAQILEEIEMLQNNGRFRAELLHQMQEINQALVVIAGALANLSKHDKA
jgi:predicted component of type VI protein secretion system